MSKGKIKSEVGPWAMVPLWIMRYGLSKSEWQVYIALRTWADQDGEAFPGIKKLAERAHVGHSTAETALRRFRELGFLITEPVYVEGTRIIKYNNYTLLDVDPELKQDVEETVVPPLENKGEAPSDPEVPYCDEGTVPLPDEGTKNTPFITPDNPQSSNERNSPLEPQSVENDDENSNFKTENLKIIPGDSEEIMATKLEKTLELIHKTYPDEAIDTVLKLLARRTSETLAPFVLASIVSKARNRPQFLPNFVMSAARRDLSEHIQVARKACGSLEKARHRRAISHMRGMPEAVCKCQQPDGLLPGIDGKPYCASCRSEGIPALRIERPAA